MDSECLAVSISTLLKDWYDLVLAPHKRRPYLNRNRVRNLLFALQREQPIKHWMDITANAVRRYIAVRKFETPRGRELRPATLRRELQDLTNFLKFCEATDLVGPVRSAAIPPLAPSTEWINPHALDDIECEWLVARARETYRGGKPLYYYRETRRKRAITRDWPLS